MRKTRMIWWGYRAIAKVRLAWGNNGIDSLILSAEFQPHDLGHHRMPHAPRPDLIGIRHDRIKVDESEGLNGMNWRVAIGCCVWTRAG